MSHRKQPKKAVKEIDAYLPLDRYLFEDKTFRTEMAFEGSSSVLPSLSESRAFPLDFYYSKPPCKECGSLRVSKAGFRRDKRKGLSQRYLCKDCGKSFSFGFNHHSHLPAWVYDCVLHYASHGMRYKSIVESVEREGKIRGQRIKISVPTIYRIVSECNSLLEEFEILARRRLVLDELISDEWQIDDRWHRRHKIKKKEMKPIQKIFNFQGNVKVQAGEKRDRKKKRKGKFMFVTAVLEGETRYRLSASVSSKRDVNASLKALILAQKRAGYSPEKFKCDDYPAHAKAIEIVFPEAKIEAIPKSENIAVINLIESMFSIFNLYIDKHRFRKPETLNPAFNLVRHYCNFFRPHKGIGGKTPAEKVGMLLPPEVKEQGWSGLLDFAYKFIHFLKSEQKRLKAREKFS